MCLVRLGVEVDLHVGHPADRGHRDEGVVEVAWDVVIDRAAAGTLQMSIVRNGSISAEARPRPSLKRAEAPGKPRETSRQQCDASTSTGTCTCTGYRHRNGPNDFIGRHER